MRTRVRSKRRKYASGKNSFAICDRTGFKHRLKDMVTEPGTGLFVYKGWSDGRWNRVDHPLNFPAPAGEAIGLKNARPDIIHTSPPFLADDESGVLILSDEGQPIFIG